MIFGFWKSILRARADISAEVAAPPFAEVAALEYERYLRELRSQVVRGTVLAVLAVALMYFYQWYSHLPSDPENLKTRFTLARVPASVSLTGFGILAALVFSLQASVHTRSDNALGLAREAARGRFLSLFASTLVSASFLFGLFVSVQYWVSNDLDPVRVIGPLLIATVIGLAAADAGCATAMGPVTKEFQRAITTRQYQRLLAAMNSARAETVRASQRIRAKQVLLLLVVPSAVTGGFIALLPARELGTVLGGAAWQLPISCVVYFVLASTVQLSARRDWPALGFLLLLTVVLGALAVLQYYLAIPEQREIDKVAWRLLFLLIAFGVPLGAGLHSLGSGGKTAQRGMLRHLVVVYMLWNLKSIRHTESEVPAPKSSPVAVFAFLAVLIPPLSLTLAVVARQQILYANSSASERQRGMTAMRWLIWIQSGILVATGLLLIGAGVWGSSWAEGWGDS